jgi:addiction module HigA family antidote
MRIPPIHPGEILKETLDDLGMSMNQFAQALRVPANRISGIVAGERAISGETALRLARYLGTTPGYWIGMQAKYDLETARDRFEEAIRAEVSPMQAA